MTHLESFPSGLYSKFAPPGTTHLQLKQPARGVEPGDLDYSCPSLLQSNDNENQDLLGWRTLDPVGVPTRLVFRVPVPGCRTHAT